MRWAINTSRFKALKKRVHFQWQCCSFPYLPQWKGRWKFTYFITCGLDKSGENCTTKIDRSGNSWSLTTAKGSKCAGIALCFSCQLPPVQHSEAVKPSLLSQPLNTSQSLYSRLAPHLSTPSQLGYFGSRSAEETTTIEGSSPFLQ